MKDQVARLQAMGVSAVAIYAGMHYKDIDRILDNAVFGGIKLLYLSPERLCTDIVRERIKRMPVNLLAVDEAHCVSQWGYDFRPSYLKIPEIKELLPKVPVIALTATATTDVVKDIQDKLEFSAGNIFQKSFVRENLAYVVLSEENKLNKLVDILQKVKGSGIVYVRSRRRTQEIASYLQRKNIAADFYHAGISTLSRSDKQEAWLNNKLRVMVSTNAFGMGIDKSDVRVVVHMDLPDSLEAYFQEAGRAGRDEQKAYAVLLYNEQDRKSLEHGFETAFPEMKEVRQVYRALGSYLQLATGSGIGESFDFDIVDFTKKFGFKARKTFSCLKILEQAGWVAMTDAVFIPSSLRIAISKEELYDFQLKNPAFDNLLKTILRSYQGAFNYPVNIRERNLAKFLKISIAELDHQLLILRREGIIDFSPHKDEPQLVFLSERLVDKDLVIDQEMYNFRKNRQQEKIRSAINYAEHIQCRSQQLVRYFGEEKAGTCGICDVCLGRNKVELTDELYQRFKAKIKKMLVKEALTIDDVVASFAPKRTEQVLKTVSFLIDEGIVDQLEEKLIWIEKSA